MQRPTPAQQRIIDEPGHLLVVAGPGSGKTGTIVRRIAAILRNPASRVVAVSFTRDSARELQQRLRTVAEPPDLARVSVGTFHGLSLRHLERHRPGLRVASPAQQRALLKACLREMDSAARVLATQQLEHAKCSLLTSEAKRAIECEPWFTQYEDMLQRNGLVDLYDVMRQTAQAIAEDALPPLPCTHLLVDEAQDCDAVQYAWTRAHALRGSITTLVGDDDQTIYEWRRAIGYTGMQAFAREFRATVLNLEENFRSLQAVVDAADRLIQGNNAARLPKTPVARRGPGGRLQLLEAPSTRACAEAIVQQILPDTRADGAQRTVAAGSWAVLARTNHGLHLMQAALEAAGVRYTRSTGSLYETPAASLMLALLATLGDAQPLGLDLAMLHAGVPAPVCGAVLRAHDGRLAQLMDEGDCEVPADVPAVAQQALRDLLRRFAVWRRFYREGAYIDLLDRLTRFVVEGYRPEEQELPQAICEAISRTLLATYTPDLAARLRWLRLRGRPGDSRDGVALHTMHGAKGLEFTQVALLGVDDATIPGDPRRHAAEGETNSVASERRLLYVAMTRARDGLVIAHTAGKGSRFLGELPDGLPSVG